ncbi:MAG: HD domain-containing protein [Flavobacteriaceae bacterium]|nr:HD domain-containing protein [Flavobacteriaceae bacterium]
MLSKVGQSPTNLHPELSPVNKHKIINDPVYGFISIPSELIYDLIDHPWVQRLRRISQLGLTSLVYPGALHTRFHHVLGAMHLMQKAVEALRGKSIQISDHEAESLYAAILLHDIGHGPYSHALEHSIIGLHHEQLSIEMMQRLNQQFEGKLESAIQIFEDKYPRKFLHSLISGQLDMDRLDYLRRDSFYTGVSEGMVGFDRILHMIDVRNDELVVEEKGIYSIEKFIIARRLMYWQVYLHKTVIAAESLLIHILRRAKQLAVSGEKLFGTDTLLYFVENTINMETFNEEALEKFCLMDDFDLLASIKVWAEHADQVLSSLCKSLVYRRLPQIELRKNAYTDIEIADRVKQMQATGIKEEDCNYFVYSGQVANSAYTSEESGIKILLKNGNILDLADASDQYNISALSQPVVKYFLCYPKLR